MPSPFLLFLPVGAGSCPPPQTLPPREGRSRLPRPRESSLAHSFMVYHSVTLPFVCRPGSCLQKVAQASPPASCRMKKHLATPPTLRCLPHQERAMRWQWSLCKQPEDPPKSKKKLNLQRRQPTSLLSPTLHSTVAFPDGICKGHSPHFGIRTLLRQTLWHSQTFLWTHLHSHMCTPGPVIYKTPPPPPLLSWKFSRFFCRAEAKKRTTHVILSYRKQKGPYSQFMC